MSRPLARADPSSSSPSAGPPVPDATTVLSSAAHSGRPRRRARGTEEMPPGDRDTPVTEGNHACIGDGETHRASASSSTRATAASSPSASSSSASRLFTDGLRLVSLFLGAAEWRRTKVWRACRQWYSATKSMHSLEFALLHRRDLPHGDDDTLESLLMRSFCRGEVYDGRLGFSVDEVDAFADSPLGRHFTTVQVKIDRMNESWESLVRCSWLHTVRLNLESRTGSGDQLPMSLAPTLARLPHLHTLWTAGDRFTTHDLVALSQLSSLRSFRRFRDFGGASHDWSPDELSAFCGPTHQLHHLTDIGLPSNRQIHYLTGDHLRHLFCLPALPLTHILSGARITATCLPHISRSPGMMQAVDSGEFRLRLCPQSQLFTFPFTPEAIVTHPDVFTRIQALTIDGFSIDAKDEVAQCMAVMTSLTDLNLSGIHFQSGADAIAGLGAAPSLTSLALLECDELDFSDLCHLSTCTRLTRLHVVNQLRLLSPPEIAELTPSSSRLPSLLEFVYEQPEETHHSNEYTDYDDYDDYDSDADFYFDD